MSHLIMALLLTCATAASSPGPRVGAGIVSMNHRPLLGRAMILRGGQEEEGEEGSAGDAQEMSTRPASSRKKKKKGGLWCEGIINLPCHLFLRRKHASLSEAGDDQRYCMVDLLVHSFQVD